jgi:NAD(P)-dependent dehydrogenase (short-subunit alcohol dehydrogenase family)
MNLGLEGKIALITGAAGDIGSAIARAFASEGMHLALLDRDGARLSILTRELRQTGTAVTVAVADVSKMEEVSRGVEEALAPHGGGIDVLVNNAGICPIISREDLLQPHALPAWHAVYQTNFLGYLHLIMQVWPLMRERQRGVILNIASDLARQPRPEMLHYSVAKAATVHLSHGLAPYLGQDNIRVLAVAPGPVRTAIWTREGGLLDFYSRKYACEPEAALVQELQHRGMAITRLIEPEEVANLLLYLVSSRASAITRCVVDIHGGSHAGY